MRRSTRLRASALSPPSISGAARTTSCQAVGHPGVGGQAVAAGAAGLLVVGLEALRQVEVGDEADVRLVDPHAEGDGRDHDHAVLAPEALLVALARLAVSMPAWYGSARDALSGEQLGRLLDPSRATGGRRCRSRRHGSREEGEELPLAALALVDDAVADVRPVEAGDEDRARRRARSRSTISRRVGGSAVAVSAMPRHVRESARQHRRARGTRAGSRGPTARRSAPRRSRRARAAARRAGRGSARLSRRSGAT